MRSPKDKFFGLLIAGFLLLLSSTGLWAQYTIPPPPAKDSMRVKRVYDKADILSRSQEQLLNRRLIGYADTTSTQIVIVTIKDLNGDDISLLGSRWGAAWGVGQASEDNGIFILLSTGDRKIDIATGYGIEYRMTDLETKTIIDQVIIPEFKQGSYYNGLDAGVSAIFQAIEGEFEGTESGKKKIVDWAQYFPFLIFFIIFILLKYLQYRNRGGRGGRGGGGEFVADSFLEYIILSGGGRSSGSFGSGGSFGGGGFGGGTFGGGSFGGGGASGSW